MEELAEKAVLKKVDAKKLEKYSEEEKKKKLPTIEEDSQDDEDRDRIAPAPVPAPGFNASDYDNYPSVTSRLDISSVSYVRN